MTSENLIRRFRRDYKLFGTRWARFCRRYMSRNVTTVIRLIKSQYGDVPVAFRKYFLKEIGRGCVGQATLKNNPYI